MPWKNKEISEVLKKLRNSKGYSLRQVEKKTGISNAYLSQLENGKIGKPSPHILYSLSEVYETSYNDLMKLIGYIKKEEGERVKEKVMSDVAFSSMKDLTSDEKEQVLRFIGYLKSQRRNK